MRATYLLMALLTFACSGDADEDTSAPATGSTDGGPDDADASPDATAPPADPGPIAGGADFGEGPFIDGDCDPLVPTHCGYPFPSNVYLVNDPTTPTGKRVEFGATTLPANTSGVQAIPDAFARSDGFSASQAPMTHLPGATVTGLATPIDIPRSLEADSPTVMINAATGEWVPHFAELDRSPLATDETRAFMIRPVVRPDDSTRYIVAIRDVVDAAGTPLEPSPVFRALRDGEDHSDPSVANRREMYDDIFERLASAGVSRDNLQLAWDFTTASTENNTSWMLHIRDQGLELLGPEGPDYVLTDVQTDVDTFTKVRIEGRVRVPLYLDQPGPGGTFVFGSDGMPEQNGWAEYDFIALVPHSATLGTPGTVVQNGHGLLGDRYQVESWAERANDANWIMVAMDWIGFASEDVPYLISVIQGGNPGAFRGLADRLCQGYLTRMAITRMMRGKLANDPVVQFAGQSAIDTTTSYYFGGSQGGIYGAVLMALTPDIERGALAVPGQPYNLLLNRSVDYDLYEGIIRGAYPNGLDAQLVLGVVQMLWDRAEPSGYSKHIVNDPLPGTPSHEVFMQVSIGDHQVNNLGAHLMARAIGVPQMKPVNRSLFAIDEVDSPHVGSVMIEIDFGNAPDPITNVPPREATHGPDPHGSARGVPEMGQMIAEFLATGETTLRCDGPCDPN